MVEEIHTSAVAESVPVAAPTVRPMTETAAALTTANGGERPDAVALVPMSTMQLAAMQQPPRHSPVPWFFATLMALAVGALSVLLYIEKTEKKEPTTAAANPAPATTTKSVATTPTAQKISSADLAASSEAARVARLQADQSGKAADEAIKERDAALMEAAKAKAEIAQGRKEWEQALVREKSANDRTQAAVAEVTKLRTDVSATLRNNSVTLADSLARLGSMQMDSKQYADATANLRQALQLREALKVEPWLMVENQSLLGNALLQTSSDAEALQYFQAAAANMEALGAPTTDADRARAAAASKRIVQFFNITGRRKEGADWKKRLDAIMAAPRPATVPQ